MYRIDGANAVTPQPSVGAPGPNVNGYFQPGTTVDVGWINTAMQEVCGVIESGGATLSKISQNQLYSVIAQLVIDSPPREGITAIVEDTTPHLGGNFNTAGFDIVSESNGDIVFTANGTGSVIFDANTVYVEQDLVHAGDTNNKITFGASSFDFINNGASIFDLSSAGVRLGGANVRINAFLDQDNMSSNSATAISTQQAAKAYVDSLSQGFNVDRAIGGGFIINVQTVRDTYGIGIASTSNLASYANEADVAYTVQADGVLSKFYISCANRTGGGTPSSTNLTATLRKNGVNTSVSFTLTGINDRDQNTGTTVSVVAGDKICWKITNNFAQGAGVNGYSIFSNMLLSYN